MRSYITNAFNAIILIGLSVWGYLSSETPSNTALIPTFIGVALLLCTSGVKKENKIIAHVAVVLTLVVLLGLIKPLIGALDRNSTMGAIRVSVMIITSVIAMITFVKSFIEARKNRNANK